MDLFPVYLVVFLVFVNRYVLGLFLRRVRRRVFEEVDEAYEPTVAIVTPLFNEGRDIYDTIQSLVRQRYPTEKLSVVVVDDCSTDDSYQWACRAAEQHPNVTVLRNAQNMGKRLSINRAVERTEAEIIVSVDSDVVLDEQAIRMLVRRFTSPDLAAVGGRVLVRNPNENWLTRMQVVKYFFGYEYLKNVERAFQTVMCLSGCLTAYRRSVLLELHPILEQRSILGVPIKYGEDRFLTRQIVKAGYRTMLALDSVCHSTVPNNMSKYFSQQLRWRRSNLVDFLAGISHAWRLPPLVGLHYLSLFTMLMAYPLIILSNLARGNFFELTFLHLGILGLLATIYWVSTRHLPKEDRVSPIWFLPMAVVMPVTYLLLTPLALFTLDSGSWETRVGAASAPSAAAEAATERPELTASGARSLEPRTMSGGR